MLCEERRAEMEHDIKLFLIPLASLVGSLIILFLARSIILKFLRRWTRSTETKLDDIITGTLGTPSIYWVLALALYISIETSELPSKYAIYLVRTLHILVILSITIAVANLSSKIFRHYVENAETPVPATGLALVVIKVGILMIGLLILLGNMVISITLILTAMGIGLFAVALALQDTLSNLFAGIHQESFRPARCQRNSSLLSGSEAT